MLTSYRDILQLLSSEDYEKTIQAIERLRYISLPPDIKFIADRFNDLLSKLNTTLDDANKSLKEASSFLSELKLDLARDKLDETERSLVYAQELLQYIQDSISALVQHPLVDVLKAPAESKLRETYRSLQEMFQRLADLRGQYESLLQSLNSQAEEIQKIESVPTQLTLELSPSDEAWVGDSVVARGWLTSPEEGIALPSREIKIKLGENTTTTATGADGSYEVTLPAPPLSMISPASPSRLSTPQWGTNTSPPGATRFFFKSCSI